MKNSKYEEFKSVLKQVHIDNNSNFNYDLDFFLKKNPDIKIVTTIVHKPYNITIIYQEKIKV